mgnify:CR=1 FL=1
MIKKLRQIAQLFSFKDIRNGLLGASVVFGGLALSFVTLYAHRTGNVELAGTAATASLVFVFIIILFVIPPLARSASAEASQLNLPAILQHIQVWPLMYHLRQDELIFLDD